MKSKLFGALIVSVCCLAGQSHGFGLLDTMLGSGCGCDCCEPQCCCEESCGFADDDCCGDDCCEKSCGCADDCCCEASCGCCEASCGCCDSGSVDAEPAEDAGEPEAAPIPSAPADPAARVAQPRKVVSASFVR